jgi:NAD(P)-dependent dehydrogenase (short-subunit alcohol dehydrogenase family)
VGPSQSNRDLGMLQLDALCMDGVAPKHDFLPLRPPFGSVTEEHFDKLFNINVRGALFTVQKALPLLNDGGFMVALSSSAVLSHC